MNQNDTSALGEDGNRTTVCFVTLEIYPATAGGVGILLHHTIQSLLRRGHEVVLLVDIQRHQYEQFKYQDRLNFEFGDRLHVYLVEDLCRDADLSAVLFPHQEIRRAARIDHALRALRDEHDIQLIEFYDYCGPAIYNLTDPDPNRPAIAVRLHNTVELIARGIRGALEEERLVQFAAERASLQGADLLLTPGDHYYEEEIKPLYPEAAPERTRLSEPIHFPVGEIEYDVTARNIVFYGRLSTFKGLDTFLRAAVLALRDEGFASRVSQFLIIGPEETVSSAFTLDDMKGFIPDALKDRFIFTGRLTHKQLMDRLSTAAFACFANRMESFCYAAHEIHTAGVPLILSDTPAFRDHFTEGETALFFDRTARGLANRMIELMAAPNQRAALSVAGRSRGQSYDKADWYADHVRDAQAIAQTRWTDNEVRPAAVILSDGNTDRVSASVASVSGTDTDIVILNVDPVGAVRFAGMRWSAFNSEGRALDLNYETAPDAVLVLRAGDQVDAQWLEKARTLMGRQSHIGAVGGWHRRGTTIVSSGHILLPESAPSVEPGLRALIRTRPGSMFQEAICGRAGETESSLMLEHRQKGRLLLEIPAVSVDVSRAVTLPGVDVEAVRRVDFDRFMPDFLAASFQASSSGLSQLSNSTGKGLAGQSSQYLAETAADRSLIILNADNPSGRDVYLLRNFCGAGHLAGDWSAFDLDEGWGMVHDPFGPVAGALVASSGVARVHLGEGARLDVLMSPSSGILQVNYRGELYQFDLASEEINDARLHFSDTVTITRMGQPETPLVKAKSLSAAHRAVAAEGRLSTLFIADTKTDFEAFPSQSKIRGSVFLANEFQFSGEGFSDLVAFVDAVSASTVIVSSRLTPDEAFQDVVKRLPESVKIVVALCGAEATEGLTPTAARFVSYGRWLGLVKRDPHRYGVMGAEQGVCGMFEAAGVTAARLPARLGALNLDEPVDLEAGLCVTLSIAESIDLNLMHMVGALVLASDRGVKIDRVWLPEAYRSMWIHDREIEFDFPISWYDSLSDVAPGAGPRIAMASYPDEEWPDALSEAAALGFLPIAGATTALDFDPDLRDALTVPYWEDGAQIARTLADCVGRYNALRQAFANACGTTDKQGRALMANVFARKVFHKKHGARG